MIMTLKMLLSHQSLPLVAQFRWVTLKPRSKQDSNHFVNSRICPIIIAIPGPVCMDWALVLKMGSWILVGTRTSREFLHSNRS